MEAKRFAEIDANKDSAVTFEEFAAHHRSMLTQAFRFMDANGDGKVTQTEMDAPAQLAGKAGPRMAFRGAPGEDVFARLDKNKDGGLSESEFAAMP
jgi:Ca2+-binding EF-hand superfamily protein